MLGGLNPKKIQAVMKQMGMSQEDIPASRVIIEKKDNTKTIIENPSVTKINMQGQDTFQVVGNIIEENQAPTISKDDIKTVMEKTKKSAEEAKAALEKTGDLAEAILELSK